MKYAGFNPRTFLGLWGFFVKMFEKKPVPKIRTWFLMESTALDSKL